jgi:hypothetical protein
MNLLSPLFSGEHVERIAHHDNERRRCDVVTDFLCSQHTTSESVAHKLLKPRTSRCCYSGDADDDAEE